MIPLVSMDFGSRKTWMGQSDPALVSSGWRWWGGEGTVKAASPMESADDPREGVYEILSLRHKNSIGIEKSLAMHLGEGDTSIADLYGVKYDESEGLSIAPHHRGLIRALRWTRLQDIDLKVLLLQIEGAQVAKNGKRFGSVRHRPIVLSPEVLERIGVEIWDSGPQ